LVSIPGDVRSRLLVEQLKKRRQIALRLCYTGESSPHVYTLHCIVTFGLSEGGFGRGDIDDCRKARFVPCLLLPFGILCSRYFDRRVLGNAPRALEHVSGLPFLCGKITKHLLISGLRRQSLRLLLFLLLANRKYLKCREGYLKSYRPIEHIWGKSGSATFKYRV
jgi:hypothetical protein